MEKVLPSPILPQVTPRNLEGVIQTSSVTTRQILELFREHARAINMLIDHANGLDAGWLTYSPTITAQAGTITTLGTVVGRYKLIGASTCVLYLDISITTNGTAAGAINFTLPLPTALTSFGAGREIALSGSTLSLQAAASPGTSNIVTYNNAYPGGSGARMVGTVVYPIA